MDPVTAGTLAIGLAGGLASQAVYGSGPSSPSAVAATPPPMAAPAQAPVGDQNSLRKSTPSFVGSSAVPQQQGFGQKTLLGQ